MMERKTSDAHERAPWGVMGSGLIILQKAAGVGMHEALPRRPRVATGGYVYRALNRAVGRSTIFEKVDEPSGDARDGPIRPGQTWLDDVNQAQTEAELKALRRSAPCGTPFGETVWQQATAKRLGLESTFRPPGRPRRLRDSR